MTTTPFDPSRPVRAARAMSVRELARTAGALIDEIELSGTLFVLSRRGRMVALLAPLPERTVVEFAGPGLEGVYESEAEQVEVRPEWLELGPVEKEALREAAAAHPMPCSPDGLPYPGRVIVDALTRLERQELLERTMTGGYKISREGLAAAKALEHDGTR